MLDRKWMPFDIFDTATRIQASIERFTLPVVYIDSLCFVEMAREKAGRSTDLHRHEYGQLRELLIELKRKKKIICPLGFQKEEIGVSKMHPKAKDALLEYTNTSFFHPSVVQANMTDIAYRAFLERSKYISFPLTTVTDNANEMFEALRVQVFSTYDQDELLMIKKKKDDTARKLNGLPKKHTSKDFDRLLKEELQGEFLTFSYLIEHYQDLNPETSLNLLMELYRIKQYCDDFLQAEGDYIDNRKAFLKSDYHTVIPYVWIQSVYWAKHRSRNDTFKPSDRNDILWASAYLPFIDLGFTDNALCDLLKDKVLAGKTNSEFYSVKTFSTFLYKLKNLL